MPLKKSPGLTSTATPVAPPPPRLAKTVDQSFLNMLAGLPAHDASELVTDKGFNALVVEKGDLVVQVVMTDVIQLWKGEDKYTIETAKPGDASQLVMDV